ncbi:hypothetical protein EVAR_64113_1 [Eumeta japonica]|uniref:Uncharacterized protein n=1 Tax=Eumeta variegata TaxID=151549 RepID=A0A4C1Z7J3_EUMVA|nr:hypothetical protein EVAR_64113_1 [Eumeta japonica]
MCANFAVGCSTGTDSYWFSGFFFRRGDGGGGSVEQWWHRRCACKLRQFSLKKTSKKLKGSSFLICTYIAKTNTKPLRTKQPETHEVQACKLRERPASAARKFFEYPQRFPRARCHSTLDYGNCRNKPI